MNTIKVDFLVIGSGIAGLSYALKAARHGRVLVITKSDEDETNTKYAQGGIAAVTDPEDSIEKHVADTLVAGDGLCDENVVRMVVSEAPERIRELISWGTQFDRTHSGDYDLAKEGGHSESRILHYKDITGKEIESSLLEQIHNDPNIQLHPHFFAVDLITQHHLGEEVTRKRNDITCFGLYAYDMHTQEVVTILSKVTLLATGGTGNVYRSTTNPTIATGDGIAMAYRAKAHISNMEFVQFHPTSLYDPGKRPSFLISEAVRGFGGVLKLPDGSEFMEGYDKRGSLAPRDIVARAIDSELKKHGIDHLYLDCRHLDPQGFIEHFPNINEKCLSLGIDFRSEMIPVVPAAHYMCGGITVDMNARSTIRNLYATGECSSTGLHGANRLASNSLLEALVYSHRAYIDTFNRINTIAYQDDIPDWDTRGTVQPDERVVISHNTSEVQNLMSDYVGIVRTDDRLQKALARLNLIYKETETLYKLSTLSPGIVELRNLINVAYLIIRASIERKENRGLYFNTDKDKL
jgi:L-aspartate oxidase